MSEIEERERNALALAEMLTGEVNQYRTRMRNGTLSFVGLCTGVGAFIYRSEKPLAWYIGALLFVLILTLGILADRFVRLSGLRMLYCLTLRQKLIRTIRIPSTEGLEINADFIQCEETPEELARSIVGMARFGVIRTYETTIAILGAGIITFVILRSLI